MKIQIFPAEYHHLKGIAEVHVTAWRQTYVGQVPQDYLDKLDVAVRQQGWERGFASASAKGQRLYVACADEEVVGFVSCGPGRDASQPESGEIYALYLLDKVKGLGVGCGLFKRAMNELAAMHYTRAYAWVLQTNQHAIEAYQRWGGRLDAAQIKDDVIGGQPVKEVLMKFEQAEFAALT